jgi:hypothetical protein
VLDLFLLLLDRFGAEEFLQIFHALRAIGSDRAASEDPEPMNGDDRALPDGDEWGSGGGDGGAEAGRR